MTTPSPNGGAATKAPPFVLPGEHFAAAFVFFVLGVVGLVWVAPYLASGAFPSPSVIGVTHLFTLGWITTSIMGALYQFLPVALGEPIRSVRAAHVSFVLHVTGLPLFVLGLVLGRPDIMLPGACVLGTGILIFVGNVAATLAKTERRGVTWWALAGALLFLLVTLALGLTLAGNLTQGYLGASRFHVLAIHLHVALAGWVLLVIVGVAQKLLPMFLLTHDARKGLARAAVILIAAGSAWLSLLHHVLPDGTWRIAALLLGSGVVCFLGQALRFYRMRHRRALDPGMTLAAVGLGFLGLALPLAGFALLSDGSARIWTAYVATVVLGISLFIAALYFKIVPFLVWFHRFGPVAGRQPVPRVAELYSARFARIAALALTAGVGGLVASTVPGWALGARLAAMVLATGALIEGTQMLQLANGRP